MTAAVWAPIGLIGASLGALSGALFFVLIRLDNASPSLGPTSKDCAAR